MPVAISFSDPVNSAAQFMDGAAQGVVASSATSQAADANNSAASLVSKDRNSSDEDFDAVLALLLNGGGPQLQVPIVPVPVKVETTTVESGTSDTTTAFSGPNSNAAVSSNSAGDSNFVNFGQFLLQSRDTSAQQTTGTLGTAKAAGTLSQNDSISDTAASANTTGLNLTGSTVTNIASAALATDSSVNVVQSVTGTTPAEQGSVSSQIGNDAEIAPSQVPPSPGPSRPVLSTPALPVYGADTNIDAATKSTSVSVLPQPLESVTAKPLSRDLIQALERIGRPPALGMESEQEVQSQAPAAKSQISTSPESGFLTVEAKSAIGSVPALKPILVDVSTTTETKTLESGEAATDPQLFQPFKLNAPVSSLTNIKSNSSETMLWSSSSKSSEAETGITTTVEFSESAVGSTALTSDLTSTASEQIQPSIASVKRRALPEANSLAAEESKTPVSSASETTAATTQSSLISSAAPNTVPDLAASISAEMRQPLTSQVSQAIMEHVERNGVRQNDSLSVRLDPPELGEMTIQLSKTHEGLAVRVTAREAVTMDMLFARGQEIESQLRSQHMNLKSLEFQRTDMSSSGFSQGQGQSQQNNSSRRSENLSNQIRGGTRGLSPITNSHPRSVTTESNYGLSFRA